MQPAVRTKATSIAVGAPALLRAAVGLLAATTAADSQQAGPQGRHSSRRVSVDYSDAAAGPFDFRYGVDHGPDCAAPCLQWSDGKCTASGPVVSVAAELLTMGASLIRTHDSGVLDWPVVFPHSLALENASSTTPDTADPANYEWSQADEYYAQIINSGLEPYFRLGTSWGQLQGGLPPAAIAYNRTALVDVLLHTVMHYNAGWGGGRNFSFIGKTQYFEVWNEPDSSCDYAKGAADCGRFWNRTAAEFFDLIDETVRAVKGYDPTLQVGSDGVAGAMTPHPSAAHPHPNGFIVWKRTGIDCAAIKGPCDLGESSVVASAHECEARCNSTRGCLAFVTTADSLGSGSSGGDGGGDNFGDDSGTLQCQLKSVTGPGKGEGEKVTTYVRVFPTPGPNPYSWGLIQELGKRKTPLDFFSWHAYIDVPQFYTETATEVRRRLDAAGLTAVKQHVTEWFPCILCKAQDTFDGAASFGASLTNMINAGVAVATLYPACSMDEGNKTGGHGWGLFDIQSEPGTALWRPLTHTYAQFGELMQRTPHQLPVTIGGDQEPGFTVLAGRADTAAATGADSDVEAKDSSGGSTVVALRLLISSQYSNYSSVQVAIRGLPPLVTLRYSAILTNQSVVMGGNARVTAAGELQLPQFEVAPPAVAFVRVDTTVAADVGATAAAAASDVGAAASTIGAAAADAPPVVGAIRWDAWYGDIDPVGAYVEEALTPQKWRYRLPFFAKEVSDTKVTIHGNTTAVMEQELAYAEQYGIDYWAFVAYPPPSHMFYANALYLEVTNRTRSTKVKFCLIMDGNQLGVLGQQLDRIVGYFALPTYQTVLGGRPLVFTFISADWPASQLAAMVNVTIAAGLPKPYIVSMGWGTPQTQMALARSLGADAISQYAFIGSAVNGTGPDVPNHPLSYQSNADQEAAHYEACASAGIDVLPSITAGWDPRPREVIAPPWQHGGAPKGCNVSGAALCHVEDPTMAELTAQTKRMVKWVGEHKRVVAGGVAKANAVILSAWNEHDEGHWICPSLKDGTAKLEAIKAGLAGGEADTASADSRAGAQGHSSRRPHPASRPPLGFNHCNIMCGKDWNASMQMKMMDEMVAKPGGGGKSLAEAGYVFANLDDGWMLAPPTAGPRRGAQVADPDWLAAGGLSSMPELVHYAHQRNLSFGLYTARGGITCGGFEASCGQEVADAQQYAAWGVSFVKDDDCSPCSGDYDADYTRMGTAIADTEQPMALMVEGVPDARVLSAGCTGVTMKRVGHDVAPTWRSVASNFDLTSGLAHLAHPDPSGGGRCAFWNDLSLLQIDSRDGDFNCANSPANLAMCRAHVGELSVQYMYAAVHDCLCTLILCGKYPTVWLTVSCCCVVPSLGMYALLKSPLIISTWLPSLSDASRQILTNPKLLGLSQDSLGQQARRVKSKTPANATTSSPRDASAVLAKCNASKLTQRWRASAASSPIPMLVTQRCNSSEARQTFTLTARGELRHGALCVDSNTSTGCRPEAPCDQSLLRSCNGGESQRWVHDLAANRISQRNGSNGSSGAELCLIANHYDQQVGISQCEPLLVNRSVSANGRSNEVWSVDGDSIRPGSSNSFLVASGQCLTVADLLISKTAVWTQDSDGRKWWLSSHGDPGIIEVHDDPSTAQATSSWTVTGTGETFAGQPAVTLESGLCLSWSAEFGASGPLPFTRHMLIEAQQRMNGRGCAEGPWTMPMGGSPGPIKPATDTPLDSDDHVGGVMPVSASEWCLDVTRGGNLETWTGELSGGRHVVALLNRSPSAEKMTLSFADDLMLRAGSTWRIDDVWSETELQLHQSMLQAISGLVNVAREVPAHGVEIMVLSPSSE